MKIRAILAVVSVAVLCACAGVVQTPPATSAQASNTPHPDIDTGISCAECHAGTHPEVVAAWEASAHGMTVLCIVCHGSVSEDFVARPSTTACLSCHGEQVATMSGPFMSGKDCFTCHAPHALNPHAAGTGGQS